MATCAACCSIRPRRQNWMVGTHLATGIDMEPHMPTSPQNLGRALQNDWEWWGDHADEMNERFSVWLAQ